MLVCDTSNFYNWYASIYYGCTQGGNNSCAFTGACLTERLTGLLDSYCVPSDSLSISSSSGFSDVFFDFSVAEQGFRESFFIFLTILAVFLIVKTLNFIRH